jgi:hypothetical protein
VTKPHHRRTARVTVEACLTLAIDQMVRRRILQPGGRTRGTMTWNDEHGVVSSVSYQADMTNPSACWLRLIFTTGHRRQVDQRIPLAMTYPRFGGSRCWFVDGGQRAFCSCHGLVIRFGVGEHMFDL